MYKLTATQQHIIDAYCEKFGGDGRSTRSGCSTQQLHELALKEALEMI